jgi:hypothetical protein
MLYPVELRALKERNLRRKGANVNSDKQYFVA